jgi:hypothetical protein
VTLPIEHRQTVDHIEGSRARSERMLRNSQRGVPKSSAPSASSAAVTETCPISGTGRPIRATVIVADVTWPVAGTAQSGRLIENIGYFGFVLPKSRSLPIVVTSANCNHLREGRRAKSKARIVNLRRESARRSYRSKADSRGTSWERIVAGVVVRSICASATRRASSCISASVSGPAISRASASTSSDKALSE